MESSQLGGSYTGFGLLKKSEGCNLSEGVIGLGLGNDLFQFVKDTYEVEEDETLYTGFRVVLKNNSTTEISGAELLVNERQSPVGCSQNMTYNAASVRSSGGISHFQFKFDASFETNSNANIQGVPGAGSSGRVSGPKGDTGHFFRLKNSQNFIKQVRDLIGSGDSADISKAPTIRLKMSCIETMDLLRFMNLEIAPEDYIVETTKGQFQILVGDVSEQEKTDFEFGYLFLTKYELFIRVLDDAEDKEDWVVAGLGDINYTVNKALWIGIAAAVGAGLLIGMIVVAFIFRGKGEEEEEEKEGDDGEYQEA